MKNRYCIVTNISTDKLHHLLIFLQFKGRHTDRRSTSGRIFVSSVSCTGSDSLDLQGRNNYVNDGHRSHGLCSKVIRLKNGEDSEIAEMELREFYGRTSTIRSTGNYAKPYNLANGDVNNNNFTMSSGEHHYPFWNSASGDERSKPRSTRGATTKIEVPGTLDTTLESRQAAKFKFQDRLTGVEGGRTRDAQRSRHWILRSGIQKPDNRSAAPRQSLGTTIAV